MILTLDIDNTTVTIGCLDKKRIYFTERIATNQEKTPVEHAVLIKNILDIHQVVRSDIEGGIIASVVPALNDTFLEVMRLIADVKPMVVGPGLKTGVNISVGDPGELGAGLVVAAAAAQEKYALPLVIVDLGTATTFSVINRAKEFIGVIIYPGVLLSYNALAKHTAQLPQISFAKPLKVIGETSVDSMQSGMLYGNAAVIDGIIERIEDELGEKCTIVATGVEGLAEGVIPCCRHDISIDKGLLMDGLRTIYYRNVKF